MPNNLLIFALGGPDGVGKTTTLWAVSRMIYDWVEETVNSKRKDYGTHIDVSDVETPSLETFSGITARDVLADERLLAKYNPLAMAQLFVTEMKEIGARKDWRANPEDDRPHILIAGRWTESAFVYQGCRVMERAGVAPAPWGYRFTCNMEELLTIIAQAPRPTATYILDAPDEELDRRIAAAGKLSPNDRDGILQSYVRIAYRDGAENGVIEKMGLLDILGPWVQIDASRPVEVVAADIAERIKAECRRLRPDVYGEGK